MPFDNWGGRQIAKTLGDNGLEVVEIAKNTKNFSPPMKELVAAIASGRFHHDGNPILSWMMGNVISKPDANDNDYPRKQKNAFKIDGAVCLLMGINRVLTLNSNPEETTLSSHLERHGIRKL